MSKKILIAGGLVGLIGAGGVGAAKGKTSQKAADEIIVVKCLGVAKAGHNGCGSTDGRHNCAGKATKDLDPTEWVYLPDGPLCENIGGKKYVKDGKIVKKKKPKSKFIGGDNA